MAIIQSILVGKGKGKIGNVVLSGLKGQTVAKQLNSSPLNPRTTAQTDNRVKMANAVLAWQFLSLFFASAKGLRKSLESVYNAFVRTVKNGLSDALYESRAQAGAEALKLNLFNGNWFSINFLTSSDDRVSVMFSAYGVQWAETFRVRVICLSTLTGEQLVAEIPISEEDFAAGTVPLVGLEIEDMDMAAAYIYDSASSKITNVLSQTI